MRTVQFPDELDEALAPFRRTGAKIGFVPTMGALHEGHLSLIRCSLPRDTVTVVSIFVNPTQFNDPEDLRRYPRMPGHDLALLENLLRGDDVVFLPDEKTIYPEPDHRHFDLGDLDTLLEGAFRPGHFQGVAQVVSRLFGLVRPARAYFGEKDFQQLAVIRRMVHLLSLPVEIVPCPIIREKDGLAMSSRNLRLSEEARRQAPRIYETLLEAYRKRKEMPFPELEKWAISRIDEAPALRTEYFRIVRADTFRPARHWDDPGPKRALTAVWAGDVRLIDNIPFD